MNKELEALEWLNYYKSIIRQSHKTFRPNGFDIIETALKDYQDMLVRDEGFYFVCGDDIAKSEQTVKKLKALEIIRTKKGLNLDYLKTCENVEQYNKTHLIERTLVERYAPLYHLTQEEFDLLKEVLL